VYLCSCSHAYLHNHKYTQAAATLAHVLLQKQLSVSPSDSASPMPSGRRRSSCGVKSPKSPRTVWENTSFDSDNSDACSDLTDTSSDIFSDSPNDASDDEVANGFSENGPVPLLLSSPLQQSCVTL
jgi:hypothetical protein